MHPSSSFSIYIVEDHPAVQRAYRDLFGSRSDLEVVGMADSAEAALQEIPELAPDIAIIDVSLRRMNGIELIAQLIKKMPQLRTLMISGHEQSLYAESARAAGACGYVMKTNTKRIMDAVYEILEGREYFAADDS